MEITDPFAVGLYLPISDTLPMEISLGKIAADGKSTLYFRSEYLFITLYLSVRCRV